VTENSSSGRNVLVVSTDEEAAHAVAPHLDANDSVKVVVPVVGQGLLDWLANDEKAFSRADGVAGQVADELPGDTVDARAGESDIALAIRDALATFPADEIVVAVSGDERVVEAIDADEEDGGRRIDGIPVRVVRGP
jgi:hypothetical protein